MIAGGPATRQHRPVHAVVRPLILVLFAGCATAPPPRLHGPDYFNLGTQPDVVLGYFIEPHLLGVKGCLDITLEQDPEDPGYGHCIGPEPAVTLVVEDVIFGHLEHARWKLTLINSAESVDMPIGRRHRVLAYPERWGVLGGGSYQRLARTRQGDWALPVGAEADMPWLPCSSERMLAVQPLDFARPHPKRKLAHYEPEDIEELHKNPHVTIRDGVVHFRAGVLLSEIYALRDRIPTLGARDKVLIDPCLRK